MAKSVGQSQTRQNNQVNHVKLRQWLDAASAYADAGQIQQAITTCQAVIREDSNNYQAYNLMGILAYFSGQDTLAMQLLQRSIAIKSDYADAHNNLGEIYRSSWQFEMAFKHLQTAVKLKPNYIDAINNLGNAMQDVYQFDQAIQMYERVLKLKPQHLGALSNLANLYQQLGQHLLAMQTYTKLLAIAPDYDWALGGLLHSKMHSCDWADFDSMVSKVHQSVAIGKRVIKPFDYLAISDSAELQQRCAENFVQYATQKIQQMQSPTEQWSNGVIRIAYISSDFRQHPVAQLVVGLLERHDRLRFRVVGISIGADDGSELRARIENACDEFYDVRLKSDAEVAAFIRSQAIDVVVDLTGYTTNARPEIFAYHAAKLQIAYLGYAGTSGAQYMDYLLADHVAIPSESTNHYSEKILVMSGTYFPRDTTIHAAQVLPHRQDYNLPENSIVFCAFNQHFKITPVMFSVWMRILQQVPQSVLWLSNAGALVKENLYKAALQYGIEQGRLIFASRTERIEDHLARHALADLYLDTTPYNAHTTASDALWAGLPILTFTGNTMVSRVATSLLHAADLPELCVSSLAEYESKAVELALNPNALATLKAKLKSQVGQAFDQVKYMLDYEALIVQAMNQKIAAH